MTHGWHAADPAPRVEAAFRRIHREQMAGVPIVNPLLEVEAIGFRRWDGHWLGMLVTPWAMNLMLLPGQAQGWTDVAPQQRRFVRFPFGDFAFLAGAEPELGAYQSCSLFSPMEGFDTQSAARATAQACLASLMQPAAPAPAQRDPAATAPPVPSRRSFLGLGGSRHP